MSKEPYSGFQWEYLSSLPDGPIRARADSFMLSVDWQGLLNYASDIRSGIACKLLAAVGLGHNHMVRILRFDDKTHWVARLRLPSLDDEEVLPDVAEEVEREASTIALVKRETRIRVPEVYAFESDRNCVAKAPFMLLECFDGNFGMDLGMEVPLERQPRFFKELADIQVELATIRLPMIGTIQGNNADGTILQGPIPGLGGPFATATEFFQAWCARAKFGLSRDRLLEVWGPFAAELIPSIESFPSKLALVANRLSAFSNGPFPLIHGDFGHNDVIVNDEYQLLA